MKETLKVSAKSNPNAVAGAIANIIRAKNEVVLQSVGAGALNQAVKSIAIARGFVASEGYNLVCVPSFAEVTIEGQPRTGIKLSIELQP